MTTRAVRDTTGAALAGGFVVLLLASEGALSLPDETAAPAKVASFYADHRTTIVVLQVVGFVAAALLALYCYRLRRSHPAMAWAGVATGVLACAPGVLTVVTALVADPSSPAAAGTWNQREPRGDDLLFLGVLALGVATALTLPGHPVLRVLGGAVAVLCVARLGLEASGHARGALESLAPLLFVVLVLAFTVASARGRLPLES